LPPQPELDWSPEGAPRAVAFDDVYFSRAGGLAEADAVFLAGCDLPNAWRGKDRFAICELGFGTGVNVLATWSAWKKTRSPHAQLHISSIEAFPLAKEDAARALSAFADAAPLAQALLARWPVRAHGSQRFAFPDDGLTLTIHIGDAETILAGVVGRFDAWFLDGFAPARNPAMWSPALFDRIAALSAPDARLATFTVAGDVRRGLEGAGFEVEKKPGFGAKRERLEGRLTERAQSATSGLGLYPYADCRPARVAVIGAGIAGAACAAALTRRGVETVVLESAREVAAGASGNPAGIVMPRLDRGGGALAELFLAAYFDAIGAYSALGVFTPCGVEEFADDSRAAALADLLADPPLPEDWLWRDEQGQAVHPRAGLVRPRDAVAALLRGASVLCETEVGALERSEGGWLVRAPDQRAVLKADAVVLACGAALTRFEAAKFLPIELSRGQVEWGPGPALEHARVRSTYVAPLGDEVMFGATFDKCPTASDARERNIDALAKLAPEIAAAIDPAQLKSRAADRATTPDRAPVAGLLPDAPAWLKQYASLAHGRAPVVNSSPPAHGGVYVIGGLGARGLTLAPLLGERIASEMFGEPQALSRFALEAIHPARFLHRALKRR